MPRDYGKGTRQCGFDRYCCQSGTGEVERFGSPNREAMETPGRWHRPGTNASSKSTSPPLVPLSKLAQTRLFSGRSGVGASPEVRRRVENRLSTSCCGVRTQGARVKTVATVAIRFLLAFCLLVSRSVGCAPSGLTMGMPLQSAAATRIEPVAGAAERWR